MQRFRIAVSERKQDIPSQRSERSLALGAVLAGAPLSKIDSLHSRLRRNESGSSLQVFPLFSGRYLTESRVFGALRSRGPCGPLLLEGHGFPDAFPIRSASALCQTAVCDRVWGVKFVLNLPVVR